MQFHVTEGSVHREIGSVHRMGRIDLGRYAAQDHARLPGKFSYGLSLGCKQLSTILKRKTKQRLPASSFLETAIHALRHTDTGSLSAIFRQEICERVAIFWGGTLSPSSVLRVEGVGVGSSVYSVDRVLRPKSPILFRFSTSTNRAQYRTNRFRLVRLWSGSKRFGNSVFGL